MLFEHTHANNNFGTTRYIRHIDECAAFSLLKNQSEYRYDDARVYIPQRLYLTRPYSAKGSLTRVYTRTQFVGDLRAKYTARICMRDGK